MKNSGGCETTGWALLALFMILLNHRVFNAKTFYSLRHHNGPGSSNGHMKSAEELIPGIAVHSQMEESKDKVHNSRNLVFVLEKKQNPAVSVIQDVPSRISILHSH